jgi:transposase-like protein
MTKIEKPLRIKHQYSEAFQRMIVQEALSGNKSYAILKEEYDLPYTTIISNWKKRLAKKDCQLPII